MVWDESRTATVLRAVENRVKRASEGSVLLGAARSLATRGEAVVRNSYCYRWLTTEPDPSVIVIDLRETRTVGPFVRLFERVADPAERAWADSRLASVTGSVGAALSRSRTGRLLAALLEPPEPPENEHRE